MTVNEAMNASVFPETQSLLHPSQLRSLVILAIVAPLCIWWLDFGLLSKSTANWDWWKAGAVHFLFVIQIGLLGWAVGRFMATPVIRWTVYIWLLVLINLIVMAAKQDAALASYVSPSEPLGYAIASGELGLLVVWAVLGSWTWNVRLPMLLFGLCAMFFYLRWLDPRFGYWSPGAGWTPVLFWQTITALALCIALRTVGFKIEACHSEPVISKVQAARKNTQFSIFHLLVWTTALAPLFAVARLFDVSALRFLGFIWQPLALGTCLAIVSLLAIWCGLGREGWGTRLILTLFATMGTGTVLAWASSQHWLDSIRINRWYLERADLYYQFWITWTTLASCFLASLLMILRASDQRLVMAHRRGVQQSRSTDL